MSHKELQLHWSRIITEKLRGLYVSLFMLLPYDIIAMWQTIRSEHVKWKYIDAQNLKYAHHHSNCYFNCH